MQVHLCGSGVIHVCMGHGFAQTACLITMKRDPLEDH